MNKDTVLQSVRDYIQDDKAKYAIMLSGGWGTGKTYLYEHGIADVIRNLEYGKDKKKRKSEVYISLYGVSTIEELTKEIVVNYFLKCKLNENATGEKAFKGVSKITGIVSKMLSFSVNNVSVSMDKVPEIFHENTDFKDMVICFDDLERCSIPINNLFGLINNLVEHCNCKVIIIADEDNIGKMYANTNIEEKYLAIMTGRRLKLNATNDKGNKDTNTLEEITIDELKEMNEKLYSENFLYRDIKEKVIGFTLKHELRLDEEYETIVKDSISGKKLKDYLMSNRESVLGYMDKCDNQNIRIMKNWLINFERIYKMVERNCKQDKQYIDEVIKRFLIYSIRVACAVGKNTKMQKWKKGEQICANPQIDDGFILHSEGYKFIDMLFLESVLDEEATCHAISYIVRECKTYEEQKKKNSTGEYLSRLQGWRYLEDEEITDVINNMIQEIKEKKYIYQQYQKILSLLVFLKKLKLYAGEISDITDIMIKNINEETEDIEVENMRVDFDDKELEKEFQQYYLPVYNLMKEKNKIKEQDRCRFVINDAGDDWAKAFEKYCQDNHEHFLKNLQFIQYFDLEQLLEKVKTAKPEEVYNVEEGFCHAYRYGNIREYYHGDILKLEEFIEKLEECKVGGVTKVLAVETLIATLNKKLEALMY